MRLWTLHPKYLDAKGLVALWREALLAQKVLQGYTRGYRNHPQLLRFKQLTDPAAGMAAYLEAVWSEAQQRGYNFDRNKIAAHGVVGRIAATDGQMAYEWAHLLHKLQVRAPVKWRELAVATQPEAHPSFEVVRGDVEQWEKL